MSNFVRSAMGWFLMGLLPSAVGVRSALSAEVQVFILAGQSNAVGSDSDAHQLPPGLYASQQDVLFWFEEGTLYGAYHPASRITSGGAFVPLKFQSDPYYGTFGGVVDGFGPEIKLGRRLADALSADVAIVKIAFDATSLKEEWRADLAGLLYDQMVSAVVQAMSCLGAMGRSSRPAGFFWMQGEADAWLGGNAAQQYESNLSQFIQHLRADLGVAGLPFVFGRLNTNIWMSPYGITQQQLAMIRVSQAEVAWGVQRAVLVNTDDLPLVSDYIHFTAAGQLMLGDRFADAWLDLAHAPADLDGDYDVDAADLNRFTSCARRAGVLPDAGCEAGDFDADGDVDQSDFGVMQRCFSGPNNLADVRCADESEQRAAGFQPARR